MLSESYGDEYLSYARVFDLHKRFSKSPLVEDDRPDRPSKSKIEEKIVRETIWIDRILRLCVNI